VRAIFRTGVALAVLLVVGASPGGALTEREKDLIEAARRGDRARVAALLRAGASVDARDREAGTALDVAEKEGRTEIAALLRANGARGSGKSVGDTVCVTPWDGSGFCGRVESRRGNRHRLSVLRLEGCGAGCPPDEQCSGGRPVGGGAQGALRPGDELEVPSWCLTRTAVAPRR
jgi:hypothetical protein